MSFRKEIKLKIKNSKILEFKNFLIEKKFSREHPERLVKSIYFDNRKFDMFKDSLEGSIPRKKIRLRSYNSDNEFFLEKKISSLENRFKLSKICKNYEKFLKNGILDETYGLCKKKITVSYLRNYYRLKEFRVTIDKNIKFEKSSEFKNSIQKFLEPSVVVEVKCPIEISNEKIFEKFPFEQIRFSKYSEGIEKLRLI